MKESKSEITEDILCAFVYIDIYSSIEGNYSCKKLKRWNRLRNTWHLI